MPYFAVEDFKAGLDVRRSMFTSVPGTLQRLVNAHITRGGDVEKRKEFTPLGAPAPATTFGAFADNTGLMVFGSVADPGGLPAGWRYQRLQAPTGAAMTGIAAVELFGGLAYVAADFDDGTQWHFYDGQLVGDWGGGIVRTYMADNDGIAQHLADLINGGGIYTATRAGSTLTIVGPPGVTFDPAAFTTNVTGGADDQELIISVTGSATPAVAAARAVASFALTGGVAAPGNQITQVTVYEGITAVDLLPAPVLYRDDPRTTAGDIAAEINDGAATHGYTATVNLGVVFLYASRAVGAAANGRQIQITTAGPVCSESGSFAITAGTAAAGANQVIMVKVDGRDAMAAAVDWDTSNSATAAAIAAAINAFASVPKIVAVAVGETVFMSRQVTRSDDGALTIAVSTSGTVSSGTGSPPPTGTPGSGGVLGPSAGLGDTFSP